MNIPKERPAWRRLFGLRELLMLALVVGLAGLGWRVNAQASTIASLDGELKRERQQHAVTRLSLRTAEFRAANRELDTMVKGDILDDRIAQQVARAEELEKEAAALRQQLLRETDCVTPRAIRNAEGL